MPDILIGFLLLTLTIALIALVILIQKKLENFTFFRRRAESASEQIVVHCPRCSADITGVVLSRAAREAEKNIFTVEFSCECGCHSYWDTFSATPQLTRHHNTGHPASDNRKVKSGLHH